jgi:choline dehydrogenase-like flavoprotein
MVPEDFRLSSLTGHGLDWPIDYGELEPYYRLGEQTLRVAGDDLDDGHPPRSGPFPLAAKPFPARDQLFLDLARDQGWPTLHHNTAVAMDGGAFTGDSLLDRLEEHPRFRLHTSCVATRILCSSRIRASAIEGWDLGLGKPLTVAARTVVVCAGGIETPNLLRLSANPWWPEGLGNHSGHLGRHLISHTGFALGGRPRGIRLVDGPIAPTAATRHFDTEKDQGSGKYLLLWRPAPTGLLTLNTNLEQFPAEANAVTMGAARTRFGTPAPLIRLSHDAAHTQRKQRVAERIEALATRLGLELSLRREFDLAHPMSTARMSAHPRDGVVDADLRVHGMDNLYVCGSASFSTGGAVNPTMTIVALAHRLGAHLSAGASANPKPKAPERARVLERLGG